MFQWAYRIFLALLLASAAGAAPAEATSVRAAPKLQKLSFNIDGVAREAWVYLPEAATNQATPLVFVFHGHGGSAQQVARSIEMARYWPEAISVYMQGLPTPGQLTDPQGRRAGWQARAGDQGDRDLKFFDAVLARLKQGYQVDERRVYATGHSNGGGFTYLLWAERGDVFAAVAPSAAVATYVGQLKPKPAMHLAGERDALVQFSWQERMMAAVRRLNGCEAAGQPWAGGCTLYASSRGTPLVTYIHPGGHEYDRTATPKMVRFFQEQPAAAPAPGPR